MSVPYWPADGHALTKQYGRRAPSKYEHTISAGGWGYVLRSPGAGHNLSPASGFRVSDTPLACKIAQAWHSQTLHFMGANIRYINCFRTVGVPPTSLVHHESQSSRSIQADELENRHCTPSNYRRYGGRGMTGPQATPHRTTFRYTLERQSRIQNNKHAGDLLHPEEG